MEDSRACRGRVAAESMLEEGRMQQLQLAFSSKQWLRSATLMCIAVLSFLGPALCCAVPVIFEPRLAAGGMATEQTPCDVSWSSSCALHGGDGEVPADRVQQHQPTALLYDICCVWRTRPCTTDKSVQASTKLFCTATYSVCDTDLAVAHCRLHEFSKRIWMQGKQLLTKLP